MKREINTIIAIAVVLGVVWLWNEGLFASTYDTSPVNSYNTNNIEQPLTNNAGDNGVPVYQGNTQTNQQY